MDPLDSPPKPKLKAKAKAKPKATVYKPPPPNEQLELIKKHFPSVTEVKGKYQSKLYTYITEMSQLNTNPDIWVKPDDPQYPVWTAWMTFEGQPLTIQDAIWIAEACDSGQPELQAIMTSWIAKQVSNLSIAELENRIAKESK